MSTTPTPTMTPTDPTPTEPSWKDGRGRGPRRRSLRLALAGGATGLLLVGLAACGGNSDPMSGMDHGSGGPSSSAPGSTGPSESTGTPAAGPHNDADVMFAQMMIPHHQQAVEMSDIVLGKSGVDARVTKLAEQIKAAQAPEIAQMRGWLAGWNAPSSMDMDHGSGDDGMMTPAEMDALRNADSAEATKMFLSSMVKHHQGAIAMAKEEIANGQNPDAKKLAQAIVDTQQAEITTMNELLKQL